jgi:hypothetical protein
MRTAICVCLTALTLTGCIERHDSVACVPVLHGWATAETKRGDAFVSDTVRLAGHDIRWNGKRIDELTLIRFTRQLAPSSPVPFLIFDPGLSPDCAFATHVRDILDQNYPCREGACGQGPVAAFIPR